MLTPEERRGALLILGLVLLGAAWDLGRVVGKETPPPAEAFRAGAAVEPPGGGVAFARVTSAPAGDPTAPAPDSAGHPAASATVDVNHAGPSELDALPGIGPVLAQRILEHRLRNGAFRSLEELRAVRGIGPSLIARLRGRVRFGP